MTVVAALAWRNRAFGSGTGFAWVGDSNTYAVLESKVKLRVFKNLEERGDAGMKGTGSWAVDAIYGGPVLGARGMGFVIFWGWESGEIVRRIDVVHDTSTLIDLLVDDRDTRGEHSMSLLRSRAGEWC